MDQQGQGYLYPGLPIRTTGHATNFQPQTVRAMAASGGNSNFDGHYLPERRDGALFYGTVQYNGVHHHHHHHHHHQPNLYPPFIPSSLQEQLPSSSGYGGTPADHQPHHHHNNLVGPCKTKVPESVQGNYHHFNAPISSFPLMSARHPDGVPVPDPASFSVPPYNNHLSRGSGFASQHFQPTGVWLENHMGSTEGTALAWNQPPAIPFMHVPMETASIGIPRQNMRHTPPVNPRHQALHASPIVPRPREQHNNNNLTVTPAPAPAPAPTPSLTPPHRSSSISSRANRNLPHGGSETGHRHAGAVPPTGIRIYRPHRGAGSEAASRNQHIARLRYLHSDEVAILEIPDYYEISDYIDHHGDMRLDIEDMSYEELLALGERIGNVNTGLSEETITGQLKTVSYLSSGASMNQDEAESSDKEAQCCIICQDNYKNMEKIGVLDCGHDYHAECLKKWLVIKNVCPICKSEALRG